MANLSGKRAGAEATPGATRGPDPVPGKRSLVELIQHRDAAGAPAAARTDEAAVHAAAATGVASPASPLPHHDAIQRAFGRHDISGIQAHTGASAVASADAMGAEAYATGHHVVLGAGADLFTAAHEAAHVVQQRGGVQLKGGVGRAGDEHEQHADEVAGRVVQGRSAEDLLDRYAGAAGVAGVAGPVQHRLHLTDTNRTFEGPQSRRDNPAAFGLIQEVSLRIAALQFNTAGGALGRPLEAVWNWIGNGDHPFASVDAVVNQLFLDGLLYRPLRGAPVGPQTLGDRPAFTGGAADMQVGAGEHRRHVISASTLGKAIEDANVQLADVNAFLVRHQGQPVTGPVGSEAVTLRNAKRAAWSLVNSHTGNLWAGPGPANVAIGFIRSPLLQMANRLNARAQAEPTIAANDAGLTMPAPQGLTHGSAGEAHWLHVTGVLREMLAESAYLGRINTQQAAVAIRNVIANCDLDLPPDRSGAYFQSVNTIYNQLLDHPDQAFLVGGTLDRFMALDHRAQGHAADDMDLGD